MLLGCRQHSCSECALQNPHQSPTECPHDQSEKRRDRDTPINHSDTACLILETVKPPYFIDEPHQQSSSSLSLQFEKRMLVLRPKFKPKYLLPLARSTTATTEACHAEADPKSASPDPVRRRPKSVHKILQEVFDAVYSETIAAPEPCAPPLWDRFLWLQSWSVSKPRVFETGKRLCDGPLFCES